MSGKKLQTAIKTFQHELPMPAPTSPIGPAIIRALKAEPRMSPRQLATYHPFNKHGQLVATYLPNSKTNYEYQKTYSKVIAWLKRNHIQVKPGSRIKAPENKVLKHYRGDISKGFIYSLSGVYSLNPLKKNQLEHELDCAWIFALYGRFLDAWDGGWDDDETVHYDRRMRFRGESREYLIEVDRNSEKLFDETSENFKTVNKSKEYYLKSFNYKIDKYLDYYHKHSDDDSQILIIVGDYPAGFYDKKESERRAEGILELLKHRRLGNHFLVALTEQVKQHPYGPVFFSPLSREPISIMPDGMSTDV